MSTKTLEEMSPIELEELGLLIGKIAKSRPDITHRIVMGIRKGMGGVIQYGFGDILWGLYKWWHHHISTPEIQPNIPFDNGAVPSGVGRTEVNWKFTLK